MTNSDESEVDSAWWARFKKVDASELEEIDAWYAAFARQSTDPSLLGDGRRWGKVFGSGRSGARAALFHSERGPIVLKWDELEKVTAEAEARKGRPDEKKNLDILRERGAAHIAVHPYGATEPSLFGIIAYKYAGPGPEADSKSVGDFDTLLREWFPTEDKIGDFQLRQIFKDLIGRFSPSDKLQDGVTPSDTTIINLPDLKRDTYLSSARRLLANRGLSSSVLDSLKTWWTTMASTGPGLPDSRLVHGDPRFANIIVNLVNHRATLIDFGAGSSGRHVFHDLARFEVDMLFRLGPVTTVGSRNPAIRERLVALLVPGQPLIQGPRDPGLRPAEIWRDVRDSRFQQIALKPDDGVREQYAVFLVNELLRRLKWHDEGNDDASVGASVSELLLAIQIVMLMVPAPGTEGSALPVPEDELELAALLEASGCDHSAWATGGAKTLGHLLAELREGDCELFVDGAGLGRRVRNVWIDVFAPEGDDRRLVEQRQEFIDGRTRERPLPASLGEKAKFGEDPALAARRGIKEELGVDANYELSVGRPRNNPMDSTSYPGLRSVYETHWFVARLGTAAFAADGYIETQTDKQTFFKWETPTEQAASSSELLTTESRTEAITPIVRSGGKFSTFVESEGAVRVWPLGSARGSALAFVPLPGPSIVLAADASVLALSTPGQVGIGWVAPARPTGLVITDLMTRSLPQRFERARTLAIRDGGHIVELVIADDELGTFTLGIALRSGSWLEPVRIGKTAFRAAVDTALGVAAIDGEGRFIDVDGRFGHPFEGIDRLSGFDCVETTSGLIALGWGTSPEGRSRTLVARRTPDGWTDGVELEQSPELMGWSLVRSLEGDPVVVSSSPTGSVVMEI